MTIAEQMHTEGRTKGLSDALVKLLTAKFGALSDENRPRVEKATATEMERYIERVLTAATIDDVLGE